MRKWARITPKPAASGSPSMASCARTPDLSDLVWNVAEIVSICSRSIALRPGDLIYTGTPAGVGPVARGDTITGGIEGLGEIELRLSRESLLIDASVGRLNRHALAVSPSISPLCREFNKRPVR